MKQVNQIKLHTDTKKWAKCSEKGKWYNKRAVQFCTLDLCI